MESKRKALSFILILIGFLLAIGYPYLLYFTSEKTVLKIIKATFAIFFIAVGAFLGSTGLILYKGLKTAEAEEE